jgi:hypothetical protein
VINFNFNFILQKLIKVKEVAIAAENASAAADASTKRNVNTVVGFALERVVVASFEAQI